MPTRLAALAATAALGLVAATPALGSAPYWTQAPSLDQQGNQLFASYGGWSSYSGPVTKFVFRFVRDGVSVKGPADPLPQSTPGTAPLPAGTYPDDPTANIYPLGSEDSGHCFVVEVWGGIRSTYYTQDGMLAYDAWEWGHNDTFGNPGVTNQVCVGGTPSPSPSPPPPPPPAPPPPPPPAPQLAFVDTSLPAATVGLAYTRQLSIQNGTNASFSVSSGALPSGLTLTSDGMLSGTPTIAGQFTFTVKATDPVAKPATQALSLQVVAPDLVIAPQILRGGRANVPYSQQLSVVGGYAPYSYSLVGGSLPNGMSLSTDGLLSGTPDVPAGQYSFQVGATDKYGLTTSLQLVFTVLPPRMAFETQTLPNGFRFLSYRVQLAVSGGGEPYAFTIVAGALPAGLVLGKDGTVYGRAQRAGSFGFTVQATDANGVTRKHYYSLRIRQLVTAPKR